MRRLKEFLLLPEISNNRILAPNFDDKFSFVASNDDHGSSDSNEFIATMVVSFNSSDSINGQRHDDNNNINNKNEKISMKNASFSWDLVPCITLKHKLTLKNTLKKNNKEENKFDDKEEMKHGLSNLTITIKKNEFYAIVGPIGSGKSSLLSAIIGELPLKHVSDDSDSVSSDSVNVNGTIGYVSQKPWIFNGSVRDNILFGNQFNQAWYQRVVRACALVDDLKILPHSDSTVIGERGINLSGGQKGTVCHYIVVFHYLQYCCYIDPIFVKGLFVD